MRGANPTGIASRAPFFLPTLEQKSHLGTAKLFCTLGFIYVSIIKVRITHNSDQTYEINLSYEKLWEGV